MTIRRALIAAGLGLFFVASSVVALNLSGVQAGTDGPVTATSNPSARLQLTTTLDHRRLIAGRPLMVHLELRNTGAAPVPLPADQLCFTPLRLELLDASGRVAWSQPVPMIACPVPPPGFRKQSFLNPGEVRTADACFQLDPAPGQCSSLGLAQGTYRVGGTYYGFAIPQAEFRILR
jgi:hypothetical protein